MAKPKQSQNDPLIYTEFNGLADSLWSGIKGSFYKMVGLDIHSQRGSVTVQQKLSQDDGGSVTEGCIGLNVSDGSVLWFSKSSGNIWRESGGTYTLVHTNANGACLGCAEFNGNVYYATASKLGVVATTSISNFAGANDSSQTFTAGDASWHPMAVVNAALFGGDGHLVWKVDSSGNFTANAIDLIAPIRVKCLIPYDIDLVIGTTIASTVGYSYVVEWDTISTSWQYMEYVWENAVNSLFWDGTTLLANAGQYGKIYYYTSHQLKPYKRIPGTWNPTNNGEILPNAAAMWNGLCVFGLTADNGNPCDQAVYTLGSYDKDYPEVLNEDFPISTGNFTGITINSVIVSGQTIYVSWTDNAAGSGIDKIDYSNKYASAYLETMAITRDFVAETTTNYDRLFACYQSMPSGCSIAFAYYQNWGSKTVPTNAVLKNTTTQTVECDEGIDLTRVLRMRIDFTVSGNTSPVIESFGITAAE